MKPVRLRSRLPLSSVFLVPISKASTSSGSKLLVTAPQPGVVVSQGVLKPPPYSRANSWREHRLVGEAQLGRPGGVDTAGRGVVLVVDSDRRSRAAAAGEVRVRDYARAGRRRDFGRAGQQGDRGAVEGLLVLGLTQAEVNFRVSVASQNFAEDGARLGHAAAAGVVVVAAFVIRRREVRVDIEREDVRDAGQVVQLGERGQQFENTRSQ